MAEFIQTFLPVLPDAGNAFPDAGAHLTLRGEGTVVLPGSLAVQGPSSTSIVEIQGFATMSVLVPSLPGPNCSVVFLLDDVPVGGGFGIQSGGNEGAVWPLSLAGIAIAQVDGGASHSVGVELTQNYGSSFGDPPLCSLLGPVTVVVRLH